MNTIKFVIVVSIILVSFDLIANYAIKAYGFVDGNNNGRDDVEEWKNSPQYNIPYPYLDDDKINRQRQCDIFNGSWNNTDWGSCTFRDGTIK
jgi:hypothetical protein